ncbi:MAG TPA: type II toxin-antitoxin system VapC family toxin [Pyrinomonadaceae bacterium]|jgi:PIN domain nuclease of toxin-antitoxin system
MKILIDTHVFLWAAASGDRLPRKTLDMLADPKIEKVLSIASVWEIAIKYGKGSLPLPEHPSVFIPFTLAASDIRTIPITMRDALAVADLPRHHGDPFDRLLIAQAKLYGMHLLTDDKDIMKYDVDLIRL